MTYTSPSQSIDLQEELHLNKAFQQFILNYAVVHGGLLGSTCKRSVCDYNFVN